MVKEEHISVTWEPSGMWYHTLYTFETLPFTFRYLGHFTPEKAVHPNKPAKMIAEQTWKMS